MISDRQRGEERSENIHVTILEELPDTGSRVGLSDLGSLLGVEPD